MFYELKDPELNNEMYGIVNETEKVKRVLRESYLYSRKEHPYPPPERPIDLQSAILSNSLLPDLVSTVVPDDHMTKLFVNTLEIAATFVQYFQASLRAIVQIILGKPTTETVATQSDPLRRCHYKRDVNMRNSTKKFVPYTQINAQQEYKPSTESIGIQSDLLRRRGYKRDVNMRDNLESNAKQFMPNTEINVQEEYEPIAIQSDLLRPPQYTMDSNMRNNFESNKKQKFIPYTQINAQREYEPFTETVAIQSNQLRTPFYKMDINMCDNCESNKKQFIPYTRLNAQHKYKPTTETVGIQTDPLRTYRYKRDVIMRNNLESNKKQFIPYTQINAQHKYIPSTKTVGIQSDPLARTLEVQSDSLTHGFTMRSNLESNKQSISYTQINAQQEYKPPENTGGIQSDPLTTPHYTMDINMSKNLESSKKQFIPHTKINAQQTVEIQSDPSKTLRYSMDPNVLNNFELNEKQLIPYAKMNAEERCTPNDSLSKPSAEIIEIQSNPLGASCCSLDVNIPNNLESNKKQFIPHTIMNAQQTVFEFRASSQDQIKNCTASLTRTSQFNIISKKKDNSMEKVTDIQSGEIIVMNEKDEYKLAKNNKLKIRIYKPKRSKIREKGDGYWTKKPL